MAKGSASLFKVGLSIMSGVNTVIAATGIWDMGKKAEDNQGCAKGF
jgi:hypothetical protein